MRRPQQGFRLLGLVVMATVALFVLTEVLSSFLAELTGWSPDVSRFEPLRGNVPTLLAGLGLVWTVAAFGEEMLFRGILLSGLKDLFPTGNDKLAWTGALVLSSAAFGAAHAYQGIAGFLVTAVIGFGFGLTYFAARRNLWAPILTHGLYDTVGFVLIFLSWDQLLLGRV
jgi:membrane protease YdiL (CAAX protease family)